MARSMGPNVDRSKVDIGISLEEWNMFEWHWNVFQTGCKIDMEAAAPQLFQCASNPLQSVEVVLVRP